MKPQDVYSANCSASNKARDMKPALREVEQPTCDEEGLVNQYAEYGKPAISNVLIVSLSTFPNHLSRCICHLEDGTIFEYYYQQEPFPMQLRERLKDQGEIIMLVSPETRKSVTFTLDGEIVEKSAQSFFIEAVRKIPELRDVIFLSIELKIDDPIYAVSEVVSHLRQLKQSRKNSALQVYLGTNGGLRGNQLVLEAVLSLLSADGITVGPDHVWSIKSVGPRNENTYAVFNSAAEFQIFDFVSGINEFLNYGRTDSLEAFKRTNPDIFDDAAEELLKCIKNISEGIQFCSVKAFEKGLEQLRSYYADAKTSHNRYIEMFRENIKNDYGILLRKDWEVLDEVEWCVRKGFYQQAITLIESSLPREYSKKGFFTYDEHIAEAAVKLKHDEEKTVNYVFNHAVIRHMTQLKEKAEDLKRKQGTTGKPSELWKKRQVFTWGSAGRDRLVVSSRFESTSDCARFSEQFYTILRKHRDIKIEIRNRLFHTSEKEDADPKQYISAVESYIRSVRIFYYTWARRKLPPLLRIKHISN